MDGRLLREWKRLSCVFFQLPSEDTDLSNSYYCYNWYLLFDAIAVVVGLCVGKQGLFQSKEWQEVFSPMTPLYCYCYIAIVVVMQLSLVSLLVSKGCSRAKNGRRSSLLWHPCIGCVGRCGECFPIVVVIVVVVVIGIVVVAQNFKKKFWNREAVVPLCSQCHLLRRSPGQPRQNYSKHDLVHYGWHSF